MLRTSGCCSRPAARDPTLALSIFAVTTSKRSKALSRPVAANTSGSSGRPMSVVLGPRPPPAAIAPGPAGFGAVLAAAFFAPAFGAALGLDGAEASSSARSRAFSALRASSALRFSSLSSAAFLPLAPSAHLSASLRSYSNNRAVVSTCGACHPCSAGRTRSAAAASCFLDSFSAFFARPDSFFAFPPFGAMSKLSNGCVEVEDEGKSWW